MVREHRRRKMKMQIKRPSLTALTVIGTIFVGNVLFMLRYPEMVYLGVAGLVLVVVYYVAICFKKTFENKEDKEGEATDIKSSRIEGEDGLKKGRLVKINF